MKKAMFALLIVAALCVFTTSVALAGYGIPGGGTGPGDMHQNGDCLGDCIRDC